MFVILFFFLLGFEKNGYYFHLLTYFGFIIYADAGKKTRDGIFSPL